MTTSDARKRIAERRTADWPERHPSGHHLNAPVGEIATRCPHCQEIYADVLAGLRPTVDPGRNLASFVVDGVELNPHKILRDGFQVDHVLGRVSMTMTYDQLQVTYADAEPEERPLPTEPGTLIRTEIVGRPHLGRVALELHPDGRWLRNRFVVNRENIAPGWVRLVEETQP